MIDGTTVHHRKTDSFRVLEELELLGKRKLPGGSRGLRYRPSFIWYSDLLTGRTEVLENRVLNFTHNFTPNLQLALSDTLRASQLPELQEDNYIVRGMDDNYYNSAIATLAISLRPETRWPDGPA